MAQVQNEKEITINGTGKGVEKDGAFYRKDQNGNLVQLSGFFHIEMPNKDEWLGTFKNGEIDKDKNYFMYKFNASLLANGKWIKGTTLALYRPEDGEDNYHMIEENGSEKLYYTKGLETCDNWNDFPEIFKDAWTKVSIRDIDEASLNASKLLNNNDNSLNNNNNNNNNNQQNNSDEERYKSLDDPTEDSDIITRIQVVPTNNKEEPILQFINNNGEAVASFDYHNLYTYKKVAMFLGNYSYDPLFFLDGEKKQLLIRSGTGSNKHIVLPISNELCQKIFKRMMPGVQNFPWHVFECVRDFALEEQEKEQQNNNNDNKTNQPPNTTTTTQPPKIPEQPKPSTTTTTQQPNTTTTTTNTTTTTQPPKIPEQPKPSTTTTTQPPKTTTTTTQQPNTTTTTTNTTTNPTTTNITQPPNITDTTLPPNGGEKLNDNNNNENNDKEDDKKEKKSYLLSFLSGGAGAVSITIGVLMKDNKIALIACCSVGALSLIGCVIYSIYAYSNNKDIKNKSSNNNLNNKGQEQENGK